jgi:predicted glycosyltransferase
LTKSGKSIWIDLDNSPHVPLFLPIVRHYRENGIDVLLTARDHSQTLELLDLAGLGGTYTVVGTHAGASKLKKAANLLSRAVELARHVGRHSKPAVAVSHGSRSMVLAARLQRIPVITMYDYEFTETRIFNMFSDRVLVPDGIDDEVLDRIGLRLSKRHKYPGLKEELYIREFAADSDFREKLSNLVGSELPDDAILVVLRPPASTANYHDARSDSIFAALLQYLADAPNAFTIIVPRTRDQGSEIKARLESVGNAGENLAILRSAVKGLDLINSADVVISGGGTMNREAVLLGVPVYSIFQGEQGSLDRKMERSGEIVFIRSVADLAKLRLEKRPGSTSKPELSDRVEQFVRKHIDFFVASRPQS